MSTMQKITALFAGKPQGTILQMGAFQPHDVVLVHENPVEEDLSNATTTDLANVAVILLTDGVDRDITFSAKIVDDGQVTLIVASTIAQDIIIKFSDTETKTVSVEANKPLLLSLSNRFGIPVAEGSSFFI